MSDQASTSVVITCSVCKKVFAVNISPYLAEHYWYTMYPCSRDCADVACTESLLAQAAKKEK